MTIKMRILIPMIAFTIIAAATILISDIFQFSHYVEDEMNNRLNAAALTALNEIDGLKAQTNAASLYLAKDPRIISSLEKNDDDTLLNRAVLMNENTGVNFCIITGSDGIIRVSTHNMHLDGTDGSRLMSISLALSGYAVTTIEPGISVPLAVSSAAPVYNDNGEMLGVVLAGFPLGTDEFVDSIKRVTDCEVSICLGDERIATTIKLDNGERAHGTKAPPEISRHVLAGTIYSGKVEIMSNELISKYYPLSASDRTVVGMLFVGHYTHEATDTIGAFVRMGLLFMLGCTLAFTIIISYISGHIVKPINEATVVLSQISKGYFDARVVGKYKGDLKIIKDSVNNTAIELSSFLRERDKAERIARESELAKARAIEATNVKSRFLASMSHEIRTPLNSVIGMSELLSFEHLTDKQRDYVKNIKASSTSLLGIINDILDMTKIEAGKLTLMPVSFKLEPFIMNIASVMKYAAQTKGIGFILDTETELPECLFGDDVRIRQILLNLLSNAIKFTDSGSVTFSARYADGNILFTVTDTGMGIRESDLKRLFDSFEQLDSLKNRHRQGTGLGLPITKKLTEMMQGQIQVSSIYGEGTTFTVSIPLSPGDISMAANGADYLAETLYAEDASILLVDDNEANLNVGSGLLRINGIECDTACDGAQALRMVQERDYDIVFMDHMMPGMDGVEATSKIRGLKGKYENLIIIALTANAVSEAREMFINAGMNDFLAKPIDRSLLVHLLKKWLPPEKVRISNKEKPAETNISENDEIILKLKQVESLNIEAGLELTSGSTELYKSTLKIIMKRIPESADAMSGFLENGELDHFAIAVHGIKSSLATAGARELSRQAFDMEIQAGAGEADFCRERFSSFYRELLLLHKRLCEIFTEDMLIPVQAGDTQTLRPMLDETVRCLNEFDDETALNILTSLCEFDFGVQINELIVTMFEQIEVFDYDSAAVTAESIYSCL